MSMNYKPRKIDDLLLHNAHDREVIKMALTTSSPINVLFHGPAGTGKTTAMQLMSVEALVINGIEVAIFTEALRTGDVILLDQSSGYGKDALDSVMERTAMISLSGSGKRWVIVDEFDSIDARHTNRVKTLIDELNRRSVSVYAATNHIERIDTAVRNRFREIHMARFGRETMLSWLHHTISLLDLPQMDDFQAITVVNRAAGSMRSLCHELDQYIWRQNASTSAPHPPKPSRRGLKILKGGA